MKQVPLSGKRGAGKFALVDDADYALVSGHQWHLNHDGYAQNTAKVGMHRLIIQPPSHLKVDHWNGIRLDNQRANLRVATDRQNAQNHKARNGLQYKGVAKAGYGQYRATFRGRSLGKFPSREAAARAWNEAALAEYGEFARLNEVA